MRIVPVLVCGLALSACDCGGTLTLNPGSSRDGGLADDGGAGGGAGGGVSGGGAGGSGGSGNVGGGGGAVGGGGGGPVCAGNSGQAATRPVDLIIAVDQSASMGEEITGVISNINAKLASILAANNVDYRVIFVGGNFCIAPPLGVSATPPACYDSNPPRYFHAPAPVNSSDALTLLLWTYDGFYKTPNTCNKVANPAVQWSNQLRFDAQKVFIVVTDDDPSSFSYTAQNCTSTTYCANWQCPTWADRAADWPGGQDFVTELYKLQPAGMFGTPQNPKWIFHAIVSVAQQLGPTEALSSGPLCAFNGNTGETTGLEYQKLAKLTGGTRFPTCDTDYSPVFQKIANSILPLACEFDLLPTGLGVPDPATTTVSVGFDGGVAMPVTRDESQPCQLGANGWQLAANGTRIVLCGAACDAVRTNPGAQLTVSVGCQAGTIDGGYDGGSIDETSDGGSCVKVGQACQVGGARCCFGLECTPVGDGGSICDSLIN